MDDPNDVDALYEEARSVRTKIEALWNDAQVTDVLMKGAVSAAQRQSLSDNERGSAVSVGLQNAQKWRTLAVLSERLGMLIEAIEQAKATRGDHL